MDFEITVEEIDKLVNQVNQAIGEVNDVVVRRELEFMKARLADMRVALLELENVEDKYLRGDVTADNYFDRRKKLVRDFFIARDQIPDTVVTIVTERASSSEVKAQLIKFKELLKDNKKFIDAGIDFVLTVVKSFIVH
jgi:hypothetical protein